MTFRKLGGPSLFSSGVPLDKVAQRKARNNASRAATGALTGAVINFLNMSGFKVWRNNNIPSTVQKVQINPDGSKQISQRYKAGMIKVATLDIIGFRKRDGAHVEIEIKSGKDSLSKEQREHLAELQKAGCISFAVKDFDTFREQIKPYL